MLHFRLIVLSALGFSTVNASTETLAEIDHNPLRSTSSALQQVQSNTPIMKKSDLQRSRHQLRMSLVAKRSTSIHPPCEANRTKIQLKLQDVEQALKEIP